MQLNILSSSYIEMNEFTDSSKESYFRGLFYNKKEVQSFAVISIEIKCLRKSSASYSADVMKPEGTEKR